MVLPDNTILWEKLTFDTTPILEYWDYVFRTDVD